MPAALYGRVSMPDTPPAFEIVPIGAVDPRGVDALLDAAFGQDRRRRTAYRIRDGMAAIPGLSYAATAPSGALLGTLQSWPVALDGRVPLILVGPVAVTPALQRGGVGRAMMHHLIAEVDRTETDSLVLIGDPEYYGRFFGFDDRFTRAWGVPGPVDRRRLLTRTQPGVTLPTDGHLGPRLAPLPPAAAQP